MNQPPEIRIGHRSRVIFADNMDPRHGIPSLADGSVALTVTSPPYWNFVDYGGGDKEIGAEDSYAEYVDSLQRVFAAIHRKTIPGGRAVVNVSNMKSRRKVEGRAFVYPIVPDTIRAMTRAGFTFFDEIIWHKRWASSGPLGGKPLWGSYPYPPTPKILDSIFENILVFTKEGQRRAPSPEVREKSKLTLEEWRQYTSGVWYLPSDRDTHHPATYPVEMAERLVAMYSFVDDLVLDPFAGAGTTVIAAERNLRAGIGYEVSQRYMEAVKSRANRLLNKPLKLEL